MDYVFDTNAFIILFTNFYRSRFPTLWEKFDTLVEGGQIVSTRESLREIEDRDASWLHEWANNHKEVFPTPTFDEGVFVAEIYKVVHFQQNIEKQKLLRGGKNADPFIIAKARVSGGAVVTHELLKPNAAKVPNICDHFKISCMTLEEFMENEGWQF